MSKTQLFQNLSGKNHYTLDCFEVKLKIQNPTEPPNPKQI